MKATKIYEYLNKAGFCDQVHLRKGNQIVFYHWNKSVSDLIPSLIVQNGKIEKINYARSLIPQIYSFVGTTIEIDFNKEHKFVRDHRE